MGSQHDFNRTLSDDELQRYWKFEIFARIGDSVKFIEIGADGWIQKLDEAFRNDEAITLFGQPMEALLEFLRNRYAISSIPSLQRFSLDLDDNEAVKFMIGKLVTPHCNIWDLELDMWCYSDVCLSLADALQNPECKLLKLAVRLAHPGRFQPDLSPFRHVCNALQSPSCKLQHLSVQVKGRVSSSFVRELGNACQTAHRLTSLSLHYGYVHGSDDEWDLLPLFFQSKITCLSLIIECLATDVLLQALKHPRFRVRHLRIRDSGEYRAFNEAEIVKFLEGNSGCPLETLDIDWESGSLREYCSQILKRNKIYRHADQQQVEPSKAKLFVCGASEVGKTTITENLFRRIGVLRSQRHLSTYGISLHTLRFGSQKLVICDLAGQKEFHAFHHYFVRGSDKDLFLVVCKAPGVDGHEEFENQLRYWLRFIVSHSSTLCEHKPRVMVALNYFPTSEKPRTVSMTQDAINRCSTLIQEYSEHINFGNSHDNVFGVVATNVGEVSSIKKQLEANLGELLRSQPMIPKRCQDIMSKLRKLRSKLVKVISVEDFEARLGMQYVDEGLLKATLMHLHDIGEVIYFEHETEDASQQFITIDVQWFVRDVVGQFLPRLSRGTAAPNALPPSSMAIADVKSRLASQCGCQEAHVPYILSSLHELGVLLPVPDMRHPISVKVLAFLTDPIENCPWKAPSYTFWGRRFICKDTARTLLPSGIFAMLQVKLDAKFVGCRIGEGWLHLVEDGIGMIVKVGGVNGGWYDRQWIDVLVRTPFSVNDGDLLEKADALFHEVKNCVFEICGSYNWGCPFIELEERVIRPEHVENLELPSAEVAPLSQVLEEAKIRVDLSYRHTWLPSQGFNHVFEILLPSERSMYFHRKLQELKAIEVDASLAQLNSSSTEYERNEHSYQLKNAVQEIVREVRESENRIINEIKRVEMTVLKQMKILQDQGDQILAKLKLHLDFKKPRYPYISNADNVLQRFPGKVFGRTWKLHLLCEHGSCHHILGQKGITITDWPGWLTDAAPVLVPTLRLLFFIGKVAAIAYVGGAMPLPSPEPLFKSLEQAAFPSLMEKVFGDIDESLKTKDFHRMSPTEDELEQFYQRFLNGKDLADDLEKHFGLYHVTSTAYEHAWVCEEHRHNTRYMRGGSASKHPGRPQVFRTS